MKKKLVIDARMIHHSGIGTYLKNLLPFIKDSFDTVLLGCSADFEEFPWADNLKIIETSSAIYSVKEQFELPRKIPRSDCFWSPHYNIPLGPLNARKRLVTVHDVFHLAFYEQLPLPQKIYAKFMFNGVIKRADEIITVSEASKSEICKYTVAAPEKITVIHNGVDKNLFHVSKNVADLHRIKEKYSLPDKFILFVGNVKPHKNLKNLVIAFAKLSPKIPDARLVVVGQREGFITGDEAFSGVLAQYSGIEEKILFTSSVPLDELPFFYNQAAVFILPSFYEGFGLPPLEAMACGCPVIVSQIDVLREICSDAVYYVDPDTPDDIAGGLSMVLSDEELRAKLKNKGFQRAKVFSWEKSAQKHIEVINRLLA
jgi:glycosyltransferase involved in cell wall biosynthesis